MHWEDVHNISSSKTAETALMTTPHNEDELEPKTALKDSRLLLLADNTKANNFVENHRSLIRKPGASSHSLIDQINNH